MYVQYRVLCSEYLFKIHTVYHTDIYNIYNSAVNPREKGKKGICSLPIFFIE